MTAMPVSSSSRRRLRWRLLRWLAIAAAIVVLTPYFLAPLYRFVDPISTVMAWRFATGQRVEHRFVALERMAPSLPRTVIAAEDGGFCAHRGVDWRALHEAFREAGALAQMRGGSSITQQLAKNLFLWPGRSFVRKVLEFPLAIWIDLVLPKRRILELYLNVAEWGPDGQFGAEAAARHAFGKSARQISPREAALLAAILPAPRARSAGAPSPAVRRLAALYEARAARSATRSACLWPRPA
ncbi:MAG: monofunctional biosynthetic peptidoglycan transglycosylase [Hyphomicrobiales bacterium]|nr:monofunctional biosynthetic peptidoglycan transglycosylase [Hyphomicrobiales bacterium]